MVVGISLFFRARREDEVSQQSRASRAVSEQTMGLVFAARDYVKYGDMRAEEAWRSRYALLRTPLAEFVTDDEEDLIQSNYASLEALFQEIVKRREELGNSAVDDSAIEENLRMSIGVARSIVSAALSIAHGNQMATAAAQQKTDSLIIIFSSILAVFMAAGAYRAVRDELVEEDRVREELRKREVRLSDAVIKLRRARQQVRPRWSPGVGQAGRRDRYGLGIRPRHVWGRLVCGDGLL